MAAAVDMDSGSIQETFEILKRWCLRLGRGLARVGWDSAISRERVTDLLRSALVEAGVPFQEVPLPAGTSADKVARDLLNQFATFQPGVVSITGLEWAYAEGGSLHETLGALNFVRETIASFPLRQIWWMPQHIAEQFVLTIPDLESWFSLRLHLEEVILADFGGQPPDKGARAVSTAEAAHLADRLAERIRNAERAGIPDERIWSELGRPLLKLLAEGGLDADKQYWLGRLGSYRNRLEARVRTLGKERGDDDPETLASKADLAVLAREQGDWATATQMWSSILEANRRTGAEYGPKSVAAMSNLAAVLSEKGNHAKAREMEEQVVRLLQEKLGPGHPEVLRSINNLTLTMRRQRDYASARRLQEQALGIARQQLGEDDPYTLALMTGLANTLLLQGDALAARRLMDRVVENYTRQFGTDHPDTLGSKLNLALDLKRMGELERARKLEEDVLEGSRRLMGERHPFTTQIAANLLRTLIVQEALMEARTLFHRNLEWLLAADPSSLSAAMRQIQDALQQILPTLEAASPKA